MVFCSCVLRLPLKRKSYPTRTDGQTHGVPDGKNNTVNVIIIIIIITSLFIEDYILSTCKYLSNIWSS